MLGPRQLLLCVDCGEVREMAKSIVLSFSPTTFLCMELEIRILLFGLLNQKLWKIYKHRTLILTVLQKNLDSKTSSRRKCWSQNRVRQQRGGGGEIKLRRKRSKAKQEKGKTEEKNKLSSKLISCSEQFFMAHQMILGMFALPQPST